MSWERMGFLKNHGGLYFKDMVCFNNALLAKQLWQLLQDPTSLARQVLKSKYYPQSSIFEATLGTRPSFAWRSLMSVGDVFRNGLLWCVGDRQNIRIWGDKWIPTQISFLIQSPRSSLEKDSRVSELIDQDTKW